MPFAYEHVTKWADWLTPPKLVESLGPFDLDPCSPINRPWDTAKTHYTIEDDGLKKKWFGKVWLNPPYGRETEKWVARLAEHGNGIALIFARTETEMFFNYVWQRAAAVSFLKGRIPFHDTRGELTRSRSVAPSILIAYGTECAQRLPNSWYSGKFIPLGSG